MSGIFISYRRAASKATTYRLVDDLKRIFGERSIFFDVESIAPGIPFAQAIINFLEKSSVAIVVIGPEWLNMKDDKGQRRLDNKDDWVRHEVRAAMASNVRVIPLLVEGASMPTAEQMPDDLKSLADLQAFTFAQQPEYWSFDVQRLTKHLRTIDSTLSSTSHESNSKQSTSNESTINQSSDKISFSKKIIAGYVVFALFCTLFLQTLKDDERLGAAFFFMIAFGLHLFGYLDAQKNLVTGKKSAIVGMVLSCIAILACFGDTKTTPVATEKTDVLQLAPAPSENFADNNSTNTINDEAVKKAETAKALGVTELVSDQLKDIAEQEKKKAQQVASVVNISGVWRGETGALQITQQQNLASYIEYNLVGVVVGRGEGQITNNRYDFDYTDDVFGMTGIGQLVLSNDGSDLSGSITESTTGKSVKVSFHR